MWHGVLQRSGEDLCRSWGRGCKSWIEVGVECQRLILSWGRLWSLFGLKLAELSSLTPLAGEKLLEERKTG